MLIQVLSFGTNWWARFGENSYDRYRFTHHACYYNSTGVLCGRKIRRRWIVPGLIRFNGGGDFNPHFPERSLQRTFECSDVEHVFDGNRLLFKRKVDRHAVADCYLATLRDIDYGQIDLSWEWKASGAVVLAASQLRDRQELMLLLKPGDWIRTSSGLWQLAIHGKHSRARLEFVVEEQAA